MNANGDRYRDRVLEIDEYNNAIWSLRMVQEQLGRVEEQPWRWKWAVVSVHSALQGFMVLALKGWDDLEVLRSDKRKELLAWLNGQREGYPNLKMDYFLELYEKIKGEPIKGGTGHTRFRSKEEHDREIERLNDYRNVFIHFLPQAWSATQHEFARITYYGLDVIRFLVFESGAVRVYERDLAEEAEALVPQLHGKSQQLMESLAPNG